MDAARVTSAEVFDPIDFISLLNKKQKIILLKL